MMEATKRHYKSTESKYKGGAQEMYVTYDLWQETRGDHRALYPKVKRVYIAGEVKNWEVGTFQKRTGKAVYGVKVDYEQSREGYARKGYTAHRGRNQYQVAPAKVGGSKSSFSQIIEIPQSAQNVAFHTDNLPHKYQEALQEVR
jgi:hypothetical protein